ncbi:MAG: FAD-dependent oxidoreductase [Rudaea sp.]|nr:FAD-dependent oxidoreductase [Rudaea sp.]
MTRKTFDFVVIGAGVFGAWAAHELLRSGHSVLLLDAYGPAHSRASSGGESRIIRMGYGRDALYTRWSMRSLDKWKALEEEVGRRIFHPTGMLWLVGKDDTYTRQTQQTLERVGVEHQQLSVRELEDRYPQISSAGIEWALWEPGSGVLMARQAVQALVADSILRGLEYRLASIVAPTTKARLDHVVTNAGEKILAGTFVFACGPWLPTLFPDLLAQRIFPTRQEVFFFAPPPGDDSFASPAMPAWFHHPALVYGLPDLESRGFKVSVDKHGARFDPETGSRQASAEGLAIAREYIARRFPRLKNAPLSESRVCQYENTSNGDFVIDHHPEMANVVIAGGGSGHGFKHGPAVGEYITELLTNSGIVETRFVLAGKSTTQARNVF